MPDEERRYCHVCGRPLPTPEELTALFTRVDVVWADPVARAQHEERRELEDWWKARQAPEKVLRKA